jgi:hypothetical protein
VGGRWHIRQRAGQLGETVVDGGSNLTVIQILT